MQRLAVRRSATATAVVKKLLFCRGDGSTERGTLPHKDALPFMPGCVGMREELAMLDQSELQIDALLSHLSSVSVAPFSEQNACVTSSAKTTAAQQSNVGGIVRRRLLDTCVSDTLPATPIVEFGQCRVFVQGQPDKTCKPLSPRDVNCAEQLPWVGVPEIAQIAVIHSMSTMDFVVGQQASFANARVYKNAAATKTLRGLDVRRIGDASALADKPMMLSGPAVILEIGRSHLRVRGDAYAEGSGRAHHITGWVSKDMCLSLEVSEGG